MTGNPQTVLNPGLAPENAHRESGVTTIERAQDPLGEGDDR